MDNNTLYDEVVEFFAKNPLAPMFSVDRVSRDDSHPLHSKVEKQLQIFNEGYIDKIKNDTLFRGLIDHERLDNDSIDKKARIWALTQQLNTEIPSRRLSFLESQHEHSRPAPYDHPALMDLEITDDCLVPLREFSSTNGSALVRNGYAFTMVPPVESTNSQYWLLKALYGENVHENAFVRLDPFMFGEADKYPRMMYHMWWYGRPLDWNRIRELKAEEHGRWFHGQLSIRAEFTDFVWSPRNEEVHFQCEEFPKLNDILTRGSRYFHTIYHVAREKIIHLDGALRIYKDKNWKERKDTHLRKSGKVGVRIKLFRIDAPVDRNVFDALCSNFFVWNNDVARYFGAELPDDV